MPSGSLVVEPTATLPHRAAAWLAETIASVLVDRPRCAIALSGGTTPGPVYAALAAENLARRVAWDRVDVFFADERAVPSGDPDSNFRMVSETLLSRVAIPPAQIHRMEGDRTDLAAAAAAYDRELPPALDVLVLGMGADGHTASLFPGSPALTERRRVVVVDSPKPPPRRLTITPVVIAAARHIAMIVTGTEKAAAVALAQGGEEPARAIPAVLARHGVWFLDPQAAARLAPVVR